VNVSGTARATPASTRAGDRQINRVLHIMAVVQSLRLVRQQASARRRARIHQPPHGPGSRADSAAMPYYRGGLAGRRLRGGVRASAGITLRRLNAGSLLTVLVDSGQSTSQEKTMPYPRVVIAGIGLATVAPAGGITAASAGLRGCGRR
jgi:hypothetical protein